MDENNFYKNLKPLKISVTDVFHQQYFFDVPPNWHIIIADVKNSTEAVTNGKHNDVNLVAAGSLIAALNIARSENIEIPFFFGGDGGTLMVPQPILPEVLAALTLHKENSIKNFGLDMHIGSMLVKNILKEGHYLKIAKVQVNKGFTKPIVIGDGLQFAERIIKKETYKESQNEKTEEYLNLSGLECRWDKIKPPTEETEIVCYLIEAPDPAQQTDVYHNALQKIDEIYGSVEKRNPLSMERLQLLISFQKLKKEMLVKYGSWKVAKFSYTFLKTILGHLFFKYNLKAGDFQGHEYLSQIISNADTLTIDGRINTIISGKVDKRLQLTHYLLAQEKEGRLVFGHHISKESIMTCYIENRNEKHIHFVDGTGGGYTEAAKELKQKRKLFQNRLSH